MKAVVRFSFTEIPVPHTQVKGRSAVEYVEALQVEIVVAGKVKDKFTRRATPVDKEVYKKQYKDYLDKITS